MGSRNLSTASKESDIINKIAPPKTIVKLFVFVLPNLKSALSTIKVMTAAYTITGIFNPSR